MRYAILVLITLAGCSVRHASDQYRCDDATPCGAGRFCDNGFCVLTGSIDAPKPMGDATRADATSAGCPPGCTTCSTTQKTCTINCQFGGCDNLVVCPAGYKCDILCNTDNSCRDGINCMAGASCNIECSGKQACRGVQCGAGPCDVGCSGMSSCEGVRCNNSCACDVSCTGSQACSEIACPSLACRNTTSAGCTSVPSFCNSCP